MATRRTFLLASAGAVAAPAEALTPRQRVDRILAGNDPDRPAFTFWYHFLDEKEPGARHAQLTLDFHRKFRTDLVKVMSDYPYPKPQGAWHDLREEKDPFPEQIKALEIIRDSLNGSAHFVETIFNPWNVAEKLSSKDEVLKLKATRPQALLDALEVIAKSEANHARLAVAKGASGIFLAVANAQEGVLSRVDYAKFSEPFDRMILDAVKPAPLNILHAHGDKVYLDLFWKGWPVTVLHHSTHGTGVSMAEARRSYAGVLMGGWDERAFRKLDRPALKRQWMQAREGAGKRYIVAPGCSVPNDTTGEELLRVSKLFGA
jgi:uroporphyrinogen decarboxylase